MVVRQMRRYFISHAPRFGSYKKPVHWKVEKSPYYFWWLALTYAVENRASIDDVDEHVLKDFGYVQRGFDKHLAFTQWWIERVTEDERRGEYLFAEPLTGAKTHFVESVSQAESALLGNSNILVSININEQRRFTDASIDRILRKYASFEKGRNVKNPKRSNASYSLSKPVQVEALARYFRIFELKEGEPEISNYELFKRLRLKADKQEEETVGDYRRRISTLVSRDYGAAKRMVESVGKGIFP
jgi:hypothetical protein